MVSGVIGVPGVYNIYNAAAALAGAMALGLDPRSAVKSLSQTGAGFGRMEKLSVGSVDVRIILVKNPVGLSRALDYLCTRKDTFRAVFCLKKGYFPGGLLSERPDQRRYGHFLDLGR